MNASGVVAPSTPAQQQQNQPPVTPATVPTQSQPPAQGVPDTGVPTDAATGSQFANYLDTMKTKEEANNTLASQRQLLLTAMYDRPLTQQELSTLPTSVQQMVSGGNRDQIDMAVRLYNQQIQGQTNTLDQSVQYLSGEYDKTLSDAETQKQDYSSQIQNFITQYGDQAGKMLEALYGPQVLQKLKDMGLDVSGLNAPTLSQQRYAAQYGITTPGTVGSYNLSTYDQSNPNYANQISTIASTIGPISDAASAQSYISQNYPSSPITGDMVMQAAQQYGVDPTVIMSLMQKESSFLSDPNAVTDKSTNNPGSIMGGPGGKQTQYATLQDGVNGIAEWISQHPSTTSATSPAASDAAPPDPKVANVPDTTLGGLTPSAVYQNAIEYAMTGKMPTLGLSGSGSVKLAREAIINKSAAIVQASGSNMPALQALYKANSSAATKAVTRLAQVDSVSNAMVANFPRLEQLADSVNGLGITESDIEKGSAYVQQKFGSPDAAAYVELLNTMRSDYSSMQAGLAGSTGGQYFAEQAQDAIPIGLTSNQYEAINQTIQTSAANAATAINGEVTSLIGTSGTSTTPGASGPTSSGGDYQAYLKAIGASN